MMRVSRASFFFPTKHPVSSSCRPPHRPPSLLRELPRVLVPQRRRIHISDSASAGFARMMVPPRTTTMMSAATRIWRRTIITTPPSLFVATTTTTTPRSITGNNNNNPTTCTVGLRWHGGGPGKDAPTVQITFLQPDGVTETPVLARVGESLLQTAHRNEIDLEGACEGGELLQ